MEFILAFNTSLIINFPNKRITTGEDQMSSRADRIKDIVKRFFNAIEAENPAKIADFFAEDGIHINPYHSDIFPEGARGKKEIHNYWQPTFPNFDGMAFNINELYAMEGEDKAFVSYTGIIKQKNNGGWYVNNYFSTFKFNESDEIIEYVEIFNPIVAAKGFGLVDQIKS